MYAAASSTGKYFVLVGLRYVPEVSDDPATLVAPSFSGYRRKRIVRVSFDVERSAVVLTDDRDRLIGTFPLTAQTPDLTLEGDEFRCLGQVIRVPDEEYGTALAYVHFVNQRIPRRTFEHFQEDSGEAALTEQSFVGDRYQYAVVNVGAFNSPTRMAGVLGVAGEHGWELVTVFDKASNWFAGLEKGFMLLKRRVPPDAVVSQWCIVIRN